jgi:hypothetical protein
MSVIYDDTTDDDVYLTHGLYINCSSDGIVEPAKNASVLICNLEYFDKIKYR